MTHMKMLLLVVGVLCLASPALAGVPWTPWNPWMPAWACTAFEYAKKCNAERTLRSPHCRCIVR
jgi:hypothetical protein